MSVTEQFLVFSRLPRFGASSFWKLIEHYGSLEVSLSQLDSVPSSILNNDAKQILRDYLRDCRSLKSESSVSLRAQADIKWCTQNDVTILKAGDPEYPPLLEQIHRAPPILYVQGNVHALHMPQIAMVGSRHCSSVGIQSAHDFARFFTANGLSVTSGLALGVDAAAHHGALESGCFNELSASTIAVLGSGIDKLYPARNRALAQQILEQGGAIVSEFPLGTAPSAHNFPQRNRIISGLSYGTLVVEAAVKSGSLITAKYALEQDREVFAIPGSIHHPLSRGCHALIKQGAKLVETAQDVVDELRGFLSVNSSLLTNIGEPNIGESNVEACSKIQNEPSKASEHLPIQSHRSREGVAESVTEPESKRNSDLGFLDASILGEPEQVVLKYLGFESTQVDTLVYRTSLAVQDLMAALLTLELAGYVANEGTGYMRVR